MNSKSYKLMFNMSFLRHLHLGNHEYPQIIELAGKYHCSMELTICESSPDMFYHARI
jgi:hypothetical protein